MRVLIKFKVKRFMPYSQVNRHTVQGFIYSLLQDTEFSDLHNRSGFKFFTYSNIFPINDFYPGKEKNLIISSPNEKLIKTIASEVRKIKYAYLSDTPLEVMEVKVFNLKPTGKFITGTPVVVQKEPGKYLSFEQGDSIRNFMDRIKDNALKKYNAFYNDEMEFEDDLFDLLQFQKEVAIIVKKDDDEFRVVGSLWSLLQKRIPKDREKFYEFLLECGLGEKNSLGFGFLNVIRE